MKQKLNTIYKTGFLSRFFILWSKNWQSVGQRLTLLYETRFKGYIFCRRPVFSFWPVLFQSQFTEFWCFWCIATDWISSICDWYADRFSVGAQIEPESVRLPYSKKGRKPDRNRFVQIHPSSNLYRNCSRSSWFFGLFGFGLQTDCHTAAFDFVLFQIKIWRTETDRSFFWLQSLYETNR